MKSKLKRCLTPFMFHINNTVASALLFSTNSLAKLLSDSLSLDSLLLDSLLSDSSISQSHLKM